MKERNIWNLKKKRHSNIEEENPKKELDKWEDNIEVNVQFYQEKRIVHTYECNRIIIDPSLVYEDTFYESYHFRKLCSHSWNVIQSGKIWLCLTLT